MRQAPLSRTDRATLIAFDGGIAEPEMCQRRPVSGVPSPPASRQRATT